MGRVVRKPRNPYAVQAKFRKAGPHKNRKKEASKMKCREPVLFNNQDANYEVCNCEEALYLKQLIEETLWWLAQDWDCFPASLIEDLEEALYAGVKEDS